MNNIKYIKRIDTTNKTNTYIDEQTIEFVLPKNKQDLSSFKIFFDVEVDPAHEYSDGSYQKRFIPRLTSSIINTMTITKDGNEIQTINDYNVIFNIINDATKDTDDIDSNRPDTLNYCFIDDNNNAKTICDFTNSTDPVVMKPLKYRCFINSFLGFLGEHSSSILDCSKHEYVICITLASKYITYRGIENTDVKISFNGGSGSGAYAYPVITDIVSTIEVTSGGSGYTNATVAFNGGGSTDIATATANIVAGVIESIDITYSGTGYTSAPNIVITGDGTGALAVAKIDTTMQDIIILEGGSGYFNAPFVSFIGGDPSQHASAIVTKTDPTTGAIIDIKIKDGGLGYTPILTSVPTVNTDYHYKLTNVFANIDVLPDSTPASSEMTFKHYKTIKGTNNKTKNTTLSHKHKGKLNYLMASFVVLGQNDTGLQLNMCNHDTDRFGEYFMSNYGNIFAYEETPMTTKTASSQIAKSLSTENNLDNSLYFKRAGSNIKSSQFFMNGQAITPAMDMPQIYNVAKEFFNNSMNRVKSLASFENEFFVFPMMINQTQEDYSTEIEWICSAGTRKDFDAYPILILCTDKTIEV